jgi:hypothetical protein
MNVGSVPNKPVIAAFDIATSTGVCFGPVGGKPRLFTIDMREGGPTRPARLAWFFYQLDVFFHENCIDQVRYEKPMNVTVASKLGVNDDTITLLHGAVAILEVCSVRADIMDINNFSVQDARHHLTGQRAHGRTKSGRNLGKEAVMRVCRMLKVDAKNEHEGDAYAGWSYACGLANPRIAHLVTPLFAETR